MVTTILHGVAIGVIVLTAMLMAHQRGEQQVDKKYLDLMEKQSRTIQEQSALLAQIGAQRDRAIAMLQAR